MDVRGKRIVVAGTGPLLLAVATYLDEAGADVLRIYDQAPPCAMAATAREMWRFPGKALQGFGFLWTAQSLRPGWWISRAIGRDRVEAIEATDGSQSVRLECDLLAIGYGLVPNLELPRLAGCRIENGFVAVDDAQLTSVPNVFCVGEPTGIGGLDKAVVEGTIAGFAATGRPAESARLASEREKAMRFMGLLDRTFALRPEVLDLAVAETLVCRCEDVPFAVLQNCSSFREARLHTRLGMGPCQGRICGAACERLFGWEAPSVRPPIVPVSVQDLVESS